MGWDIPAILFFVHVACSSVVYDDECDVSRRCTQVVHSPYQGNFPCRIGHKKECDKLLEQNQESVDTKQADKDGFAMLSSVGVYEKRYTGLSYTSPSFNFSIQLPTSRESLEKIHAIKFDFRSPKGNGADSYYSDNPICRVFNFSKADFSHYVLHQPPDLSYACIVGLELNHIIRYVYQFTIETFPEKAQLNYTVVAHKLQKFRNMTLAVSAIAQRKSVHVVFEPSPPSFNVHSYVVTLNNIETRVTKTEVLTDKHQHEFLDCPPGVYVVVVQPKGTSCPDGDCRGSYSEHVLLQYPASPDSTSLLLKKLGAAVGAVIGLLLVLNVFYFYYRYHQISHKTRTVLLLYTSNHQTFADKLDKLLESLKITTFKRMYDSTGQRDSCHEEDGNFQKKCLEVNTILIQCSSTVARHFNRRNTEIEEVPLHINSQYISAIETIEKDPCLSSKAIIICFDSEHNEHIHLKNSTSSRWSIQNLKKITSIVVPGKKSYYSLPKDFHKLYYFLSKRWLNQQVKKSPEWRDFTDVPVMGSEVINNMRTDVQVELPDSDSSTDASDSDERDETSSSSSSSLSGPLHIQNHNETKPEEHLPSGPHCIGESSNRNDGIEEQTALIPLVINAVIPHCQNFCQHGDCSYSMNGHHHIPVEHYHRQHSHCQNQHPPHSHHQIPVDGLHQYCHGQHSYCHNQHPSHIHQQHV